MRAALLCASTMKFWALISAVLAGLLVGYWIGRMTPHEMSGDRGEPSLSVESDRTRTEAPSEASSRRAERPQRIGFVGNEKHQAPEGPAPTVLLSRPDVTAADSQDALTDQLKSVASQLPPPDARQDRETASSWHERAQQRLLVEPEDTAWAPYMENAITTFLSRHPAAKEFDLEYVECRTTQCQIKVTGHEKGTGPSWQRIVQDMLREPWASFGQYADASGPSDRGFVIVQDLQRRQ